MIIAPGFQSSRVWRRLAMPTDVQDTVKWLDEGDVSTARVDGTAVTVTRLGSCSYVWVAGEAEGCAPTREMAKEGAVEDVRRYDRADFAARQVVDDLFRVGVDARFQQHVIEKTLRRMLAGAPRTGGQG
jgi:hypothetical protein